MNNVFLISLICVVTLGALTRVTTGADKENGASLTITPGSLRCEYLPDPLGVDVANPRLGWTLGATDTAARGITSTAYQILVASSPELLASGRGDLWDSGKVLSSDTSQIAYAGVPLAGSQMVWWQVRSWDGSDQPSAWSAPATWTMGLLNTDDWKGAQWIAAPDAAEPVDRKNAKPKYETLLLRREFDVKAKLKRAIVHVSGLGHYHMTVNGSKVGDAALAPGWTEYKKTCLYDTYDITASLKSGQNVAGLFLGNGFFNVHNGRYTKVRGTFGPIQAIGQIRLEYEDGSVEHVVTDAKWKAASGPITFSSVFGGEDYDARLQQDGWDTPGFDPAAWEVPAVTQGPGGALKGLSCAAPPVRVVQTLSPVSSQQLKPGDPRVTIYDLGQNAAIILSIKVQGPAGSTVKVTPSEIVHANGDINERMCNGQSYWTYTLRGSGEESYQSYFYYRGGRYLRVDLTPAPGTDVLPTVSSIEGKVVRSDNPAVGQIATSNELYNKIYPLVRWAQMSNMMSVITDCPHREKLGWLEQIHLNGPALRYNFDLSTMFTKMANDMFDAQRANGLVPSLVPNYFHWDEGKFTVPIEWGSACILVPWQQYQFHGDAQLLSRHYVGMKQYMDYLARRAKNHVIDFGLGDWYDNQRESEPTLTPVALTSTSFYFQDYKVMAQVATILGKTDDAAQFEKTAEEVRQVINKKFFDPATNNYAKGSQGANCLPLAMGIIEPANRDAVLNNLIQDLKQKGTTTGEVSFRYLLRVLADAGRSDVIYETYGTDKQGYGLQVKLGKTTLTEAWNGGNSSQNHFMFGQINEWMFHDLAGIQPDLTGPGFKKIVIKPAIVGDLTWVKASYAAPTGTIESHWTNGPTGLTLDITIPVGATATVFVPTVDPKAVKEGSVLASSARGVTYLRSEAACAVYAVGSGRYRFAATDVATAPGRLETASEGGKLRLSWTPSANAKLYTVERSTDENSGFEPIAKDITDAFLVDHGLTNGTTYYYKVRAINAASQSRDAFVSYTPAIVTNGGFEAPLVSGYEYAPTSPGWSFTAQAGSNGAGITVSGSAFTNGNPKTPEGTQAAFLQGTCAVSQELRELIPGSRYSVTFMAAQRKNTNSEGQTWQLKLDDQVLADYAPPQKENNYREYTATFTANQANHTLTLVGTNTRGGANTVFIDNVRVTQSK